MGLLDLPGELLDEIITLTLPHGIEGFVLSCKTVYQRSAAQIEHHNKLKRQSRSAGNPTNRDPFNHVRDPFKPLRILYETSQDPLLAQYINSLRLYITTDDRNLVANIFRTSSCLDEDKMERIKMLVTNSRFLQEAGVDLEDWWNHIMKENEEIKFDYHNHPGHTAWASCILITLLGQLPNLRSLQLPYEWKFVTTDTFVPEFPEDALHWSGLYSLINCAHNSQGHERPLGKLKTILPFMPSDIEEFAPLQCVEWFLALPSMRELLGTSLVAAEETSNFKWRGFSPTSSLRRIELAYCCIDPDNISELLSRTPQLQVFRYSHQTKYDDYQYDWNPGSFVDAIARNCSSTITDLAITIDDLPGEVINGCSSFLSFTVLKTLEVDVNIFCGPPIESGQWRGARKQRIPDGEHEWTVEDIPCIGSMLSPSIVDVSINTDFPLNDEEALRSLLKDIREQKAERLKQLRNVTLRQHLGDSANGTFGIPGLVVVFDGSGNRRRTREMLPAWKREFDTRVGGIDDYYL